MKKSNILFSAVLVIAVGTSGCTTGPGQTSKDNQNKKLDPENPVSIELWNYYNGAQQDAFNRLVEEFNETRGKELGIIVETSSEGSVSDLENSVLDAINEKVGVKEVPNIFAAYADTAFEVDQMGKLVDLSEYVTEEEKEEYIDEYIAEGQFEDGIGFKIFPIAKSTEVFMVNRTDWDRFADATGADITSCSTIEGLVETAQEYYEWTDSLTPDLNDGKAFFGRDAVANYMFAGAKQLGTDLVSVQDGKTVLDLDRDTIKKLWYNYYVPYVKGYFNSVGRFRSDDIKTGDIISFVGSSSGATFFPKEVFVSDDNSYRIEMSVYECPQFADSEGYAVQQGAGMVVVKADEVKVRASVEFLKWFTSVNRNVEFSISSGYLPVKKEANDMNVIHDVVEADSDVVKIIESSIKTIHNNTLYMVPATKHGTDIRNMIGNSISDKSVEDRKAVESALQNPITLEEAAAPFMQEEYFEAWYRDLKVKLEELAE